MIKIVDMSELAPIIVEKTKSGGTATLTARGTSMLPMLCDNRDVVTLSKKPEKLKKYDLPLYERKATGRFVVHRIHKVLSDGTYVISGDNQTAMEYGITYNDVLAVVTEFTHKGKKHSTNDLSYKLYCRLWCFYHLIRRSILSPFKSFIKSLICRGGA